MTLWNRIETLERRLAAMEEKLVHLDAPRPTLDDVYDEVEGMSNELAKMARDFQRRGELNLWAAYADVSNALGKVLDTIGEVRGRLNRTAP